MVKPHVYELGSSPELILAFTDTNDDSFFPSEVRLTIEQPDGVLFTVSGADLDVTTISGSMTYVYTPTMAGWYSVEGWGKDGADRQITKAHGFEVSNIIEN